jgi:hypothetical protein
VPVIERAAAAELEGEIIGHCAAREQAPVACSIVEPKTKIFGCFWQRSSNSLLSLRRIARNFQRSTGLQQALEAGENDGTRKYRE